MSPTSGDEAARYDVAFDTNGRDSGWAAGLGKTRSFEFKSIINGWQFRKVEENPYCLCKITSFIALPSPRMRIERRFAISQR